MNIIYKSATALILSLTPLASVLVLEDPAHLEKPKGSLVEVAQYGHLSTDDTNSRKDVSSFIKAIPEFIASHVPAWMRGPASFYSGKEQVLWGADGTSVVHRVDGYGGGANGGNSGLGGGEQPSSRTLRPPTAEETSKSAASASVTVYN
jgi:hypothetical protein